MAEFGTVYGLFDPRVGMLRYVGQTVRPLEVRLSQHVHDCTGLRTSVWVAELRRDGVAPVIDVLVAEVPVDFLDGAEFAVINAARALGYDLLNHAGTGRAAPNPSVFAQHRAGRNVSALLAPPKPDLISEPLEETA